MAWVRFLYKTFKTVLQLQIAVVIVLNENIGCYVHKPSTYRRVFERTLTKMSTRPSRKLYISGTFKEKISVSQVLLCSVIRTSRSGFLYVLCTFFSVWRGKGSYKQLELLVNCPYTNWKNALGDFTYDSKASYHQICTECADNFMKVAEGSSNQLTLDKARQDTEYRNVLKSTVDIIIAVVDKQLPLREEHDFSNRYSIWQDITVIDGNFRVLQRFPTYSGLGMSFKPQRQG